MVTEFVSPPNVEAQRNESIISRMLVCHKPETQKNCMTSYCLLAPSHELLQNLTSLYNWICKLLVMCRQWLNRCIFCLSLTQSQVRVLPYILRVHLHFPSMRRYFCTKYCIITTGTLSSSSKGNGTERFITESLFLLALKIQDVNYSHMWVLTKHIYENAYMSAYYTFLYDKNVQRKHWKGINFHVFYTFRDHSVKHHLFF